MLPRNNADVTHCRLTSSSGPIVERKSSNVAFKICNRESIEVYLFESYERDRSDPAAWRLVKRHKESALALKSVFFRFYLA